MQYATENKTHVSRDFLTAEEIKQLSRVKPGQCVIRVEPMAQGGKIYEIRRGGFHYATLQEIKL